VGLQKVEINKINNNKPIGLFCVVPEEYKSLGDIFREGGGIGTTFC
jgi:hypothetical protein